MALSQRIDASKTPPRGGGCPVAIAAAAALFAASCSPATKTCVTLPSPPPSADPAGGDEVRVSFLGVGGVVVRWQGAAVMTAPLYSNPTVAEIALSEAHTDRQRMDALMRHDVSEVRAILSGHSHYDHLMDVPYLVREKARKADVVGNDEMRKLLHPIEGELGARTPPNRLVSLEREHRYDVPGAPIRVEAVPSEHSPQIGPRLVNKTAQLLAWFVPFPEVTLWRGEHEHPLGRIPGRVGEWPAGTPLAFVIELLEPGTGNVAFRIYYQDSPTRRPYGYPAPATDAHRYDLAILCMGGATEFPGFPRDIVTHLDPRFVMGIHWEDFFNPRALPLPGEVDRREDLLYAPGVDEGRFVEAVQSAQKAGGRVIVPCPDEVTAFRRGGRGWEIAGHDRGWTKERK
jgi:L-ascorbate metabolism protein UlaG (beta-lactamase superfamily)